MYIFGGYTMRGNVNTMYRMSLLPLLSSGADGDEGQEECLMVEKVDPVNADEAPIASDKNVSWSHAGRFYVFGGYGNEPERGTSRIMQTNCIFLPDQGSQWVSPSSSIETIVHLIL